MTSTDRNQWSGALDTSAREFVLWTLSALGLEVRADEHGAYEIETPSVEDTSSPADRRRAELSGRRFTFDPSVAESSPSPQSIEYTTWQSPLIRWLLDELQQGAHPIHAAAAQQPLSVSELAEHLFTQYKVDNGHMHLAGCTLEDRPFLRLSYLRCGAAESGPQLVHCYGSGEGKLVDGTLRKALDLDHLVPIAPRARKIDEQVLQRWRDHIRQQFEVEQSDLESVLVAVTLIWCKHAAGKLTFSIGRRSVEVPFSGWGRLFADRHQLPPPYQCPLSGRSSYHLGAADDGQITVAEAIATCAVSSRRVLEHELQVCAVTQRRVLPEFLRECPCSGEQVLATALETCAMCQQPVSPAALQDARCSGCRQLRAVSKTDPDLARVLDAHPKLDRLFSWKMAQTRTVQTLVGSSAWKRLLVVLDKQTLEVLHVATSGRLSNNWKPLTEVQRAEWLG